MNASENFQCTLSALEHQAQRAVERLSTRSMTIFHTQDVS